MLPTCSVRGVLRESHELVGGRCACGFVETILETWTPPANRPKNRPPAKRSTPKPSGASGLVPVPLGQVEPPPDHQKPAHECAAKSDGPRKPRPRSPKQASPPRTPLQGPIPPRAGPHSGPPLPEATAILSRAEMGSIVAGWRRLVAPLVGPELVDVAIIPIAFHVGLQSAEDVASFTGLPGKFVRRVVARMRGAAMLPRVRLSAQRLSSEDVARWGWERPIKGARNAWQSDVTFAVDVLVMAGEAERERREGEWAYRLRSVESK